MKSKQTRGQSETWLWMFCDKLVRPVLRWSWTAFAPLLSSPVSMMLILIRRNSAALGTARVTVVCVPRMEAKTKHTHSYPFLAFSITKCTNAHTGPCTPRSPLRFRPTCINTAVCVCAYVCEGPHRGAYCPLCLRCVCCVMNWLSDHKPRC